LHDRHHKRIFFRCMESVDSANANELSVAEPELAVEIIADWKEDGPTVMKGFHHIHFETKEGLEIESYTILQYNFSKFIVTFYRIGLKFSIETFRLASLENQTSLTLILSNFPTETIYKHIDFYWRITFGIIKKVVEKQFGI
jgi:hypothetical protein